MNSSISLTFDSRNLPPPWPEPLRELNRSRLQNSSKTKLIVLDDDPTGTQTVYDVPVLTDWSVEQLKSAFVDDSPCFYVLTNSRAFPEAEARTLTKMIAENLQTAAAGRPYHLVSRSDSTLRGHFPLETDVLDDTLGPFDATLIIPCFEAGGRCTIEGVHYIRQEGRLIPVAETPFARDRAFGYNHSDLPQWVQEKSQGRLLAKDVDVIRLDTIRRLGPKGVADQLRKTPPRKVVVSDAVITEDIDVVVSALQELEAEGRRFLVRSAADYVAARLALPTKPLLTAEQLIFPQKTGGLIVAGSYVPATTAQLDVLKQEPRIVFFELSVSELLNESLRDRVISETSKQVAQKIDAGTNVLLATSRELIQGRDPEDSLRIGKTVSESLIQIVRQLPIPPKFLIAKGGITSSDIATKALAVRRATVLGQLVPGVPVWRLGPESRFPQLPYIVFPGNVGDSNALLDAFRILDS